MNKVVICVCYVDDTTLTGTDPDVLEAKVPSVCVNNKEQRHTFQLCNEGEAGAFLGIQIKKTWGIRILSHSDWPHQQNFGCNSNV